MRKVGRLDCHLTSEQHVDFSRLQSQLRGTDPKASGRTLCKLIHDGSKHDDNDVSELNYILIMEAERDAGKFDCLEMNINSILSLSQSFVSCVFTKGYSVSGT